MICRTILMAMMAVLTIMPAFSQHDSKSLSITLSSPGDVLVTSAEGKRLGRNPINVQGYEEIAGAEVLRSPGRGPVYVVPPGVANKPLTITIYGREARRDAKLSIAGLNFVFGVNDIPLGKGAVITIRVTPVGDLLEYSSNLASAMPRIALAIDPTDNKKPSYIFEVHRTPLGEGETLRITHLDERSFGFGDDSKKRAAYEIKIKRINADGSVKEFGAAELKAKRANHFLVDLTKWDAKTLPCLRADDNAKGVYKAKCR